MTTQNTRRDKPGQDGREGVDDGAKTDRKNAQGGQANQERADERERQQW